MSIDRVTSQLPTNNINGRAARSDPKEGTFYAIYTRALGGAAPSPASGTAQTQFTGRQANDDTLHERALALRAYRQQILASNIANADTPGYKAVDFNIREALESGAEPRTVALQYHIPVQPSIDGNTVEMDVERAKFAENSIMYEYALARVGGHFKHMSEMLQSIPY